MIPYKFKEALWSGIVVSPFVSEILLAHLIDALVNIGHKLADGSAILIL